MKKLLRVFYRYAEEKKENKRLLKQAEELNCL